MTETEYLLSSKANAKILMKSIKEAEDGHQLIEFDPIKSELVKKLVKEAQKGTFKKLGTFDEFKKDILAISKNKK